MEFRRVLLTFSILVFMHDDHQKFAASVPESSSLSFENEEALVKATTYINTDARGKLLV